jgi:hypothetical protein
MTSEPDSTARRRPPTIDLTAKEVETERPASAPEAATANPERAGAEAGHPPGEQTPGDFADDIGRPSPRVTGAHAIGAAAGAIASGVIFAGLWFAGVLPSHSGAPPSATASAPADADQTSARLDKIEAALSGLRPDAGLATRIAAAEAATKSLDNSLAALNRRLDDIAVSAGTASAHADAASAAAAAFKSAAQAAVGRSDLDALNNRIAAVENAVKALSAAVKRGMTSAEDRAARMTIAAEALRATVERGTPYEAELAAVKTLGGDANATAALEPFAADGIPSAAALGLELTGLMPALQRSSGSAPSDGSFLGRLEAHAQHLVRISPIDAPPGDNAAAVVARINADATRGDIAAALADIARLPNGPRTDAENWVKKAEAREAAIAASRRIAADALAALGTPAPQ